MRVWGRSILSSYFLIIVLCASSIALMRGVLLRSVDGFVGRAQTASLQQTASDVLTSRLKTSTYRLSVEGRRLNGPGRAFLLDEAKAAHFVLIGEGHGSIETPLFMEAYLREALDFGYDRLVIEASPFVTPQLERLAQAPDAVPYVEFMRKHPFSIPFYFWREEFELLQWFVKASPYPGAKLWGLDQELILSDRLVFERLTQIAPNTAAAAVAEEYLERALQSYAQLVASKDPRQQFLLSLENEDFQRLETAFRASATSEAGRILADLRHTYEIYTQFFGSRRFESNLQRSALMKRNFIGHYMKALEIDKRDPKLFFKFGASHMAKGRDLIGTHDLGNLIMELANQRGQKSFNLFVIGRRGTANAYFPFTANEADKQRPVDAIAAYAPLFDAAPLLAAADPDAWTLIDLRPTRAALFARGLRGIDAGLENVVLSFDAALVIPEVHASTLVQ